ncbi:anaerobic dehydrogenase subunit [Natrinema pellirubrum DSM 15624]|uniref:Anaerobic dehydrogenase subunit n=1 Tax=Natrinema pellirubrum (strain DSM 15624 / CIP 106293 / JCM 10476 / NCIMB 786 / 157) TaxID=797303 RepID=L0JSP6_NATP1|nr:molecular chaperone TorD family protein [Natrinema pellirubrum]AGB33391.1 putative component of anaerobic dehydrogenase [Natrinema pellirubrum DSM 15624]ELY71219.1 anaerobic dehydrogenase subunit [Natrinema pellirubrum DSM 15624]
MSENTILGGPPNRATDATDEPEAEPTPDPADLPGDAETAIHRSRLYSLLSLGFDRPGEDFEAARDEDAYAADLHASAAAIDPEIAAAAAAVTDALEGVDGDELHHQWAALFGVEEGVTVSPYELTYLPGPLMTNVRRLADVRGFYEAFDLSLADEGTDRGDHVCYLTEFLSALCLREASLRERGDDEGVAVVVDARRSFLEDHLGRWYWRLADEVGSHDDGAFYAALAELLAALVEHEIETLDLDPDWVPDDPEVTEWNEDVFGDAGRGCGGCGANVSDLG